MSEINNKKMYMEFICCESRDLDQDSMIQIMSIIHNTHPDQIKKCPDGSRIVLNNLSIDVLKKLYTFIKNQLNI